MLDANAAMENFDQQLSKIDQFLKAESNLLQGWSKQDEIEEIEENKVKSYLMQRIYPKDKPKKKKQ